MLVYLIAPPWARFGATSSSTRSPHPWRCYTIIDIRTMFINIILQTIIIIIIIIIDISSSSSKFVLVLLIMRAPLRSSRSGTRRSRSARTTWARPLPARRTRGSSEVLLNELLQTSINNSKF